MKVKVSYTVDLAGVPDLIKDILLKSNNQLSDCYEEIEKLTAEKLDINSYDTIVKLANNIELVRDRMTDCYSLLGSYIKTTASMKIPSDQQEEQGLSESINNLHKLEQGLSDIGIGGIKDDD